MPLSSHKGQLLQEFEAANQESTVASFDFIKSYERRIDEMTQLAIIATDFELSLKRGERPELETYDWEFAHFGKQLRELYAETVQNFVGNYCPIRSTFGSLPYTSNDFEILREVGRGGMGVVYEAMQPKLDRHVALKVLFLAQEEIFQEARSLAVLRHPNLCHVYDVNYVEGLPVMVMKFINGKQMGQVLRESSMTANEGVIMICKVARALAEAHDHNIAHFDVKPSNILLTPENEPTLTDFGLAQSGSSHHGILGGSPCYAAPEQLSEEPIKNPKLCDVYSLGTVLYEVITGRRAFDGPVADVINQVRFDPPRRPTDYRDDVDPDLEAICLKAMKKPPTARYASMLEFYRALTNWLAKWKS